MMGRQSGQMSMVILDIAELIPRDHLLRKINQMISFDFIYDLVAPYYPANGRPSVDPVSMFKMLLVGYLYGIKSERRLVQEIQLNIAYRWFCGFELGEKIPDHSTFSKTRVRKWNESSLFQQVFLEIVRCCMEQKLVDGKEMASDGSYIPAEVSRNICIHFSRCAQFCVCIFLSQCSSWGLRRYHVCLAILRWSDLRKCDVSLAGKKLSSPSSWQGTEIVRGRAYAWRYHCKLGHSSIPLRRFEILTALNY